MIHFTANSGYCSSITVAVIALLSILILLVTGKGVHKGAGRLRGKEFCQDKYDDCLGRHPYLIKKSSNTPAFCEHQIFRSYYCKTRLPDTVKTTLKPLRDRSLGGGDEETNDSKRIRALEFYYDPPPYLVDNSSEKMPALISEEVSELREREYNKTT